MWPWQRSGDASELVDLDIQGLGAVHAIVRRAVPGAAELEVVREPAGVGSPIPTRYLHRRGCRATPATPDGRPGEPVEHLDGTLLAVPADDGGLEPDLVHLVFDRVPVADASVAGVAAYSGRVQRRSFHRVPLRQPVTIVPSRFKQGWLECHTYDVSAGGVLVSGAERLKTGDAIRFVLELGDDELLDTTGHIARINAQGLAGVKLDGMEEEARERLAKYVADRQREALAALRGTR